MVLLGFLSKAGEVWKGRWGGVPTYRFPSSSFSSVVLVLRRIEDENEKVEDEEEFVVNLES